MKKDILYKTCASISFIFITLALVLIYENSPAAGYDLSLYASFPTATWIFLLAAIALGISIIVHEAFSSEKSNLWYLGFLILILGNFIILSLHFFKGYYFLTMSDPLGHMSFTANIISSGSIGENYYPITHIFGAELVEIGGIELTTIMKYLPVIFTILSMIFIYLLATTISNNKGHALLAAATGSTLLYSYYHVSTYPQGLSLLMFPMGFYLYFKSMKFPTINFRLLFIIMVLFFPFFHPAPELALLSCLIGGEMAKFQWRKRLKSSAEEEEKISRNPAAISLVIFLSWFMSFSVFGTMSSGFVSWFSENADEIPRFNELQSVSVLQPVEQVFLVLKMYGDQFIYIILSMMAFAIAIRYLIKKNNDYMNLFILSVMMVLSGGAYALFFLGGGMTTIGRLAGANSIMWVTPVLAGFAMFEISSKIRYRTLAAGAVAVILILATIMGVFTVYRSPWIYQPNMQITLMDMAGTGWANEHEINSQSGYLGWPTGYHPIAIPQHFGYPASETFGEALGKNMTLLLTEKFRQAVQDPILSKNSVVPPGLSGQGFNKEDIIRLEQDKSVEMVYRNGEFDIMHVNARGGI